MEALHPGRQHEILAGREQNHREAEEPDLARAFGREVSG